MVIPRVYTHRHSEVVAQSVVNMFNHLYSYIKTVGNEETVIWGEREIWVCGRLKGEMRSINNLIIFLKHCV